jgi:signal transduction histidine kinase
MGSDKKIKTKIRDQEKEKRKIQSPEDSGPVQEEYPNTREFLFKTFHDLKNPLHAIMGYTSLVLRKTRDQIPEKQQENLEKVLQSAEKLNEIVDRMVAFYRKK